MRYAKWIGLMSVVLLLVSCFMPWIVISSKNITVSGIDAAGTYYGKPGYFNLLFGVLYFIFNFFDTVWAKRLNIFIAVVNLSWGIRNYFMLSACQGGECPDKETGIYLMMLGSVIMLIAALFPDIKIKDEHSNRN